ncbi:unnamed protein product, partial [Ectocarpus fasciculatus]
MASANRVCHFKLVLLGDSAVGKSCLVVRFVRDEFFEFQEPTIGAYRFMFAYAAERYRSLAPMYYRGAAAAIVVYDITKKETFNGAKSWVKELQRRGDPNVVIALAGNKADMENKRKVNTEEAQQYAQDNEIIFLETSAKTSLNVKNLFTEIGMRV